MHILHTRKRKPARLDTSSPETWVSESGSAGEIPPAANMLHRFAILSWAQGRAQRIEPGGRSEREQVIAAVH